MRNAGLEEAQAGIKTARINTNKLKYGDVTALWQKAKTKQPLYGSERGE